MKPCCMGDVLMATPAIHALKAHFRQAAVDVATRAWCAPVLATNPDVSDIVPYPDVVRASSFTRLVASLRNRAYDLGISLDRSPVVAAALTLAGIPVRAGIDSGGRGIGLTHRARPVPGQHETDLYLAVVESLGITALERAPRFQVPATALETVRQLVAGLSRPLVIIHPGGAVNPGVTMLSKRWSAVAFGELASLLIHQCRATIVLVGAESDRAAVQTARDFTDGPSYDLCGYLDIPERAALCAEADLFVGNDSGISHLASAVGTPTVTIFGPTSPNRYRPLGPNARVCAPPASWHIRDGAIDLRASRHGANEVDINLVTPGEVFDVCRELPEQGRVVEEAR